ncbi:MAG TPA: tyrosine-type recombinase/integrase [Tepidisphaeraceae bacterium]
MKLHDRHFVEATEPAIYIGHRIFRAPDGTERISNPWYAEYCLHNRQRFEALGTSNKNIAIQKAHEICARIRGGQPDAPKLNTTINEVVESYIKLVKAQGRAPKTIVKYELVQKNVLTWCGADGRRRAATLTEADFWSLRQFLMETEGVGEKTAYDRLIVIKQMFKSAARQHLIPISPFAGLSMNKPESAQQPCFTPDQTATLLAKAEGMFRLLIAVLAYAGLRFGEARDLLWSDLVLEIDTPGFIVVRRGGSGGKTKGKRLRRIPIHPDLRRILDSTAHDFDRVVTAMPSSKHPDGGAPLDERRCLVALKRLCKRCGFANPNQYKLHTLRHTFASMCARNNISCKYALEWMGHRSSDILDLYYTMFDPDAHAAMKTLVYPQPSKPEENTAIPKPMKKSKKGKKDSP